MKNNFTKFFVGAMLYVSLFCAMATTAYAAEYYVDGKRGNDTSNGSSSAPFATIQRAADVVQPGDTVIIRSGIYYENVHLETNGTKEAPIVFKAEKFKRDAVIITGADRDIAEHKKQWTLEDASLGMYSIPLDYPIYRMTANDVQVVEYTSLTGLKTYTYNANDNGYAGYAPGYEHGFFYDSTNKKLYVRLGNDGCIETDDPNSDKITIHLTRTPTSNTSNWKNNSYGGQGQAAITGTGSFLFGVTTEVSSNVVISGITFKMPAVAAVWARCHDLTVSNCWFIGCIEGVRGGCAATSDPTFVSENIIVEHCFYTNYPIYQDALELAKKYMNDPVARCIEVDENGKIITDANGKISSASTLAKSMWFWHSKSGMTCNYEGGGIVCYIGDNWTIRYCQIEEQLDGFSSFGNFSYWYGYKGSVRQNPAKNITIYGNKFDKILDNAIEMEDHVQGMEISYNEFTNQMSPFSWQSLEGVPYPTNIKIHHNVVYNSPEESWFVSSARNHITQDGNKYTLANPQYFGLFKLGIKDTAFDKIWMKEENFPKDANGNLLDSVRPDDDGVRVWNNTFIFPNAAFEENVGALGGGLDNDSNFEFKNNIINVIVCAQSGRYKGGFVRGQAYTYGRGVKFSNNMLVSGLNIEGAKYWGDIDEEWDVPSIAYANEPIDDNGLYKKSIDEVGFKDWRNENFELTADSPARGAGVQLECTDESTVDMGAIPYGEKWTLTAGPYLEADVNLDGTVNLSDVAKMVYNVNNNEYTIGSDLDYNGTVDENDIRIMLEIYTRNGGALK